MFVKHSLCSQHTHDDVCIACLSSWRFLQNFILIISILLMKMMLMGLKYLVVSCALAVSGTTKICTLAGTCRSRPVDHNAVLRLSKTLKSIKGNKATPSFKGTLVLDAFKILNFKRKK